MLQLTRKKSKIWLFKRKSAVWKMIICSGTGDVTTYKKKSKIGLFKRKSAIWKMIIHHRPEPAFDNKEKKPIVNICLLFNLKWRKKGTKFISMRIYSTHMYSLRGVCQVRQEKGSFSLNGTGITIFPYPLNFSEIFFLIQINYRV
jgi:hypothetical protein